MAYGYVRVKISPFRIADISPEEVGRQIEAGSHPVQIERERGRERSLVSLIEAVRTFRRLMVVGDPGGGKSTQLRRLCIDQSEIAPCRVPVYIAVRDLPAYDWDLIRAAGALLSRVPVKPEEARELGIGLAHSGGMLLCVDGLNELDVANPAEARRLLRRIRIQLEELLTAHHDNAAVVTVRRESFASCHSELPADFEAFEVMPLTPGQTRQLIRNWFAAVDAAQGIELLRSCDVAGWPGYISNPLLLVLTCIVFERRNRLPSRLSELYRRCLDVLIEEWDATRRISRHELVKGLTSERKLDLLAEVALDFHERRRCCYDRSEVIRIVGKHLPQVGLDDSLAAAVVDDIGCQHGLLRSWSIEGHLAFPHLCFQEYLAAKALRDRSNGDELMANHVGDPFWQETVRLYASQGDTAALVERTLAGPDTLFRQRLLMAAACLSSGAKVSLPEIRSRVIRSLTEVANGSVAYLKKKAIDALAQIDSSEANDALRRLYRNDDGTIDFNEYASKYAVRIDGMHIVAQLVLKQALFCQVFGVFAGAHR